MAALLNKADVGLALPGHTLGEGLKVREALLVRVTGGQSRPEGLFGLATLFVNQRRHLAQAMTSAPLVEFFCCQAT